MFKLQKYEKTNVLQPHQRDASVIVCQGQAETLISAERDYWCQHLWHECTCNHQHHSLHPSAVLALLECCGQLKAQTGSTAMLLVQDVMTVAHKQLRC